MFTRRRPHSDIRTTVVPQRVVHAGEVLTVRRTSSSRPWCLAALGAALLLGVTVQTGAGSAAVSRPSLLDTALRHAARVNTRPNIIVFMTDDQNREEMRWLPETRRLISGHGYTFTRALSPAPLCCPARATTVTGQYGQNNGVQFNTGPFGGFQALRHKANTLGAWLQAAGYRTAEVGKYLNGYQGDGLHRQNGWTRWNPSVKRIYEYSGTTFMTLTGTERFPGHVTPAISEITARDIRAFSARGGPFFLWIAHLAPHGARSGKSWVPPIPTAAHRNVLGGVVQPSLSKPSFNVSGPDSPYPNVPPVTRARMQAEYTGRIRTLQDVDDALVHLVRLLRANQELDNTYIFFVSDNGLLMGEHRIFDKNNLYREDLEVPLVVRVPGMTTPATSAVPVTTVDLAPTILALAGATPGRVMDGQSFAPILKGRPVVWRDTQLIQGGGTQRTGPDPGWMFRGLRSENYTYMRRVRDGAEFLYDRRADPYELTNLADSEPYASVIAELRRRLNRLVDCAGATCAPTFGPLPEPGS